jgi:hypothetical protein
MTKRIIALVLVAIMAAVALVACTEDPATTPTAPVGTTTAPESSAAPAGTTTAPESSEAPVVSEEPTETAEPTLPEIVDPFEQWGGMDMMWATSRLYGKGWEVWPFAANGTYCARAFWQCCVTVSAADGDFRENAGNPADYKYTWKLWFKDTDADPYDKDAWKGPYEVYLETFYSFGNEADDVIYRIQTSTSPDGDPCKDLELGKSYDYIFQVLEGEDNKGFMMVTVPWTAQCDAEYKVYNDFWKNHDRANGYKSADQTITDADIAFATGLGFSETGAWTDPNAAA